MLEKLIDRPVTVTMAMLVAVVLGFVSIRLLPVSLAPDVDVPYITVQINAPDMSARELDESVVKPLRQQFIQINALKDIVSSSKDGSATVRLTFDHGENIGYLFIEVNEKIDRSMGSLPDIDRPKVLKASATDIPAFYINARLAPGSGKDFPSLSLFLQDVVSKRIEQLPEVAMVDVSGCVSYEILIIPDERKLTQLGIGQSEFESFISQANIRLGSLSIRDGQYRYSVKFLSDVATKEDIGNIWFRVGDRVMQLKEVAEVLQRPSERQGLVRADGEDAVCMAVIKQSGARMSDLKKAISSLMTNLENDYPEVDFEVTRDQTQLLDYSIRNLMQNIILGVLLACIVIFLFMLDFRSPALVCLTMPVALIFSMAVFYVAGLTLNIISLAGLLLGVGMMADNTIVLVDNITARWQRGDSLREAVLKGTGEVVGPMLSSILTTCAVFIPLVFVNGMAGALFYDQAMSVTIVLMTSYLVTVTIIPVFYWCWYRGMPSFRPARALERFSVHGAMLQMEDRCVNWFMRHRVVAWGILVVAFVGIAFCFKYMPKEQLPPVTYTETILKVDWNEQVSLDENEARVARVESVIGDRASQVTSLVGIQQFVLGHSGDPGASEASVYINCEDDKVLAEVKASLSDFLSMEYPAAEFSFEVSGNIFDMIFGNQEAELIARLRPVSSPEIETERLRFALSDIRKALPGVTVQDVPVKTDMLFIADPDLMALYGISYSEISSALKKAMSQNHLFSIVQGTRTLPVVTGTDKESLWDILNDTYIKKEDTRVPVSGLMRQTYVEDMKMIVSGVEGNYYPVALDVPQKDVPSVMKAVSSALEERRDFEAGFSGAWFSSREMTGQLVVIFIIAVILLYLILASQFESLLQPLLIMSEIVVDVFSALLVLWIMGVSINLMSLIGLVVVSGIVINDSILKVDTINRLRKDGMELKRAVVEASGRRMKAIIMTSLTTILAVAPFLSRGNMGDDLQYPMSLVIIVGMTVGTMVSLFVLPALYYSVYRHKEHKS